MGIIFKKLSICVLILTYLNLAGCSSSTAISKEYLQTKYNSVPVGKLTIVTSNGKRIILDSAICTVINDTAIVKGLNRTNNIVYNQPVDTTIAMSDIKYAEVEETDALKTIGCILGVAGLAVLTFLVITLASISDDLSGCNNSYTIK